jgi:hypothetical protein
LPTQSWDRYLEDLLGSRITQCDIALDSDQIELYNSFQETSTDIEEWTTGDASHRLLNERPPEEAYICYGMVSRMPTDLYGELVWTPSTERRRYLPAIFFHNELTRIQVFRAAVRLCGNMIELNKKLTRIAPSPLHGHTQMVIIRPEAQFLVAFSDGAVVGEVNAQLDKALTSIAEQGYELDLEVFASIGAIQDIIDRATREKEGVIRVQVNVYGPSAAANAIGRELSQHKLYLQRPAYIRDGARYSNPHMLTLPEFKGSTTVTRPVLEETVPENPSLRTFKNTIRDVYSSLTRDRDLSGLEGDERLNTTLLLYVIPLLQSTQDTVRELRSFQNPMLSDTGIRRQRLPL